MIWLAAALASPLVYPDGVEVQLADADGDGHIDVVLNAGEAIHYGDGLGGFGPLTPVTAEPDAEGTVIYVDLDGDGLPEACREQWDRIDCHQGVGRGIGPVLTSIVDRTFAMIAVDANGDGDQDLVVSTLDGITVHDNDGSGFLVAGTPAGDIPYRFLEADVDGDGDLDVAGHGHNGDDAWWLERDDVSGVLGPAKVLVTAYGFSSGFADASGDGLPDLLTQSYTFPIYARQRRVDGTYGASRPIGDHSGAFTVAALDPLGPPGLVVCDDDEVRWDPGVDGAYTTLWAAPEPSDRLCRTPVADVDGDGRPDVLAATWDLSVTLDPLGAPSTTTLQRSTSRMGPVAAGDVDGDGHVDLVYTSTAHDALWLVRGAGSGSLHHVETLLGSTTQLTDLAILDLTGDGLNDIAMTDTDGLIALLTGVGAGAFTGPYLLGSGARGEGVAIDADQDGVLEWVVPTSAGLHVFDDDGSGGTVGVVVPIGSSGAASQGDTDGDGVPELVALSSGDVVLLRTGAGGLVEDLRTPAPGRNAFALALFDGDGDGRDRIVVEGACELGPDPYYGGTRCVTEERLYELEENGGALDSLGLMAEANGPIAVLDWDDDGLEELLTGENHYPVLLDATYTATRFETPWPAVDLIPVDLDGDGDLDVIDVEAGGMWAVWHGDIGSLPYTGDTGTPTTDTADTGSAATGHTGNETEPGTPTPDPDDTGTADTGEPLSGHGGDEDDDAPGCGCAQGAPAPTLPWLARRR